MTDIELLPLPKWLLEGFTDPTIEMLCDYTRANVEHYTAAKDAEIEALRAEVATWEGLHASEVQVRQRWQARAERLAEALRDIESRPWNGVRPIQIASRAALRYHDKEGKE